MKHDFEKLLRERPEHIKTVGAIEYVENPYFSDKPIIAINRAEKTAIDSEFFEEEDIL